MTDVARTLRWLALRPQGSLRPHKVTDASRVGTCPGEGTAMLAHVRGADRQGLAVTRPWQGDSRCPHSRRPRLRGEWAQKLELRHRMLQAHQKPAPRSSLLGTKSFCTGDKTAA